MKMVASVSRRVKAVAQNGGEWLKMASELNWWSMHVHGYVRMHILGRSRVMAHGHTRGCSCVERSASGCAATGHCGQMQLGSNWSCATMVRNQIMVYMYWMYAWLLLMYTCAIICQLQPVE